MARHIGRFLPCADRLDVRFTPLLGLHVYQGNSWKAQGTPAAFGAALEWYKHLAVEQEEIAEAVVAEGRQRERKTREAEEEGIRKRITEELRVETRKMEVREERTKPALNITFYIKNEEKGKGKGSGKGKGKGKEKGKGKKGEMGLANWTEVNNLSQLLGQEGKERASMPGVPIGGNETPVEAFTRQAAEKNMERALIWDEGIEDEEGVTGQ